MKTFLKIIGGLLLLVLLVAVGGLLYFNATFPKVDKPKDLHVERTPERIERGRYLAHDVAGCIDCHSERDWSKYGGPLIPGTEGKGGMMFNETVANVPGTIYARNITPAGIGDWTDGELFRTITTGVNKQGKALFPLMPYMHYRNMSEEDLYSIIAYIRTLKPIENKVPERNLNFPINLIVNTIPMNAPETFPSIPAHSDSIAYGGYLVNAAACLDCHSKLEKGQITPGMEFAGGFRFCLPGGKCVTSANITPDEETGIGLLTREAFLDKFRFYRQEAARNTPVTADGNQTVMPWTQFQALSDDDLAAMYAYLRTLKPVKNKIERFSHL
jgi:cytochrome c553